ncbi:MAG: CDP-glycerol glycerophosphotransferase family protein [Chloroflexota bacterium]
MPARASDNAAGGLLVMRLRRAARLAAARLGILSVAAGFAIGRLQPIGGHVVLAGADRRRLGGNLLAIAREMEGRTPPVPVRLVGYRTRVGLRGRLLTALDAARAGYHLATARLFIVDNSFYPMNVITPRPGTTRVQVWHAAGAFKKFGYSALAPSDAAAAAAIRGVPFHRNYDLCLVSSTAAIPHYAEAFRMPPAVFTARIGIPRTDPLFDPAHRAGAAEAIRHRYALPAGKQVLLFAPTFRGDAVADPHHDETLDLAAMRDALGDAWILLLRLHPLVRQGAVLGPELDGFVFDVSDWPEMNELLLVADMLVTDYSSVLFEFALLGRPMAFFAPDHEAYRGERGFYLDVPADLPGPLFTVTGELAAHVAAGEFDTAAVDAAGRATGEGVPAGGSAKGSDTPPVPGAAPASGALAWAWVEAMRAIKSSQLETARSSPSAWKRARARSAACPSRVASAPTMPIVA